MDSAVAAALIGSAGSAGSGLFGGLLAGRQAKKQRKFAMKLQKLQWGREDTAMQRKVADLKAAGLHPSLAAGSGGSPTTVDPGQQAVEAKGREGAGAAANALERMGMQQQYASTVIDNAMKMQELRRGWWQDQANKMPTYTHVYTTDKYGNKVHVGSTKNDHNKYTQQIIDQYNITRLSRSHMQLDEQLKELNVNRSKIDLYLAQMYKDSTWQGIPHWKMDVAAKGIALAMARMDQQFFEKWGIPPSALGIIQQLLPGLGNIPLPGLPF